MPRTNVWALVAVLSLAAPAAAEDLSFDRLRVPLPSGWSAKASGAGAGEYRRLIPSGDLAGKAEVALFRSFPREGRSLEALAAGLLNRIDKGRTAKTGSKPKVSKTGAGLQVGYCGRSSTDGAGQLRYGTVYVFGIGSDRVQALYLASRDLEAFKRANAVLAPSLDQAQVVAAQPDAPKPTPSKPAPPAERVAFSRLSFPLPSGWRQQKAGGATNPYVLLHPPGEGARVFVYSAVERNGVPLETLAQRLLDLVDEQREVTRRDPAKTLRTPRGLTLAVKAQASQRADGAAREAAVYVFQVGEGAQGVLLVAASSKQLHAARRPLERALREAEQLGPGGPKPPPTAPAPKTGAPRESDHTDQGVLGTSSFASVPQSAKLKPVAHRVDWAINLPLSPQQGDIVYGGDRFGDLLWVVADKFGSQHQTRESTVLGFLKRAREVKPTPVNLGGVTALLQAKLGKGPKYGWKPMRFRQLETDRDGNLYLVTKLYYTDFPAITLFRWETKRMELVASPHYLAQLCKESGLHAYVNARWSFHPDPRGNAGWLFLSDAFGKTIWIRHLRRAAEGKWTAYKVTPRFRGAAKYGTPGKDALLWGAPDWRGGWVFYSGTVLWRLLPSGQSWPLAVFRFGSRSVSIPRPVVLENGDVWFAINRRYDVSSHTDALNRTHVFALVGDRSRWVRVRLDGKGGVQLGEIDGKVLLAALKGAGVRVKGGVVKTLQPVNDPKSKGVLAYDTHHEVLFVIQPTD